MTDYKTLLNPWAGIYIDQGEDVKEKDIENAILEYLSVIAPGQFWKVDTVGVFDPVKKVYRQKKSKHQHKGISDIVGFYQNKFVAIEVKTPSRKSQTTPEQKHFIMTAQENDQVAFVATSVDDVREFFKALIHER